MDIVVNVNIEAGSDKPKVEVNKKPQPKKAGGVLQFPAMPVNNNPILDIIGVKEV